MPRLHLFALVAAVAVGAAASATGCKKTHVACAEPPETRELDNLDDAARQMMEAAKTDPLLCKELAAPRISLTGDELVLTGTKEERIAHRTDLAANEIRRVDRLYDRLREYRMQLRLVQPKRSLEPVDLRFDPTLETARVASIVLSAAYIGYAEARLTTGAAPPLSISWFRAGPPDSNYIETLLRVEATSETAFTVQVHGPVCKKSSPVIASAAELRALVSRLCREYARTPTEQQPPERQVGRCFDAVELRAHPASRIGETASVLRAILEPLADQKPSPEIALLLAGSEPRMRLIPRWRPGVSVHAPSVDASGHCTLPDGGYDEELHFPDAGPLTYD
jgi:hypothetical protein